VPLIALPVLTGVLPLFLSFKMEKGMNACPFALIPAISAFPLAVARLNADKPNAFL
jgi:hypothetical protein